MRVIVDFGVCQSHGQCTFAAPDVFQLDENDLLQVQEHPDESQRAAVEDAVDVCPVQAIRIEG